jgi:hypothetical protein
VCESVYTRECVCYLCVCVGGMKRCYCSNPLDKSSDMTEH